MKLTSILLLAACLQVGARGYGQITLKVHDAPLEKVFAELEKQTTYQFFYKVNLIPEFRNVDLDVSNAPLSEVLDRAFLNQPLAYNIIGTTVVITKKISAPLPVTDQPSDPPIDVHGRILNEKGEAMPGVNIQIKDKRTGVISDADGAFTLHGVDPAATLIISFVGYETQEIKLAGRTAISLKLKIAPISLQDAVVNKGYYSITQRFNTGNVAVVKAEDIEKQPVADPLQALEGRVANLQITQSSGVPGAYSTVRIRGQNNLVNYDGTTPVTNNDPLYIVDGVPFSSQSLSSIYIGGGILNLPNNSLNNYNQFRNGASNGLSPFNSINPADIESIEVLKDADATAIYGSRGANGVILITTKKGKQGKLKADISVLTGVSHVASRFDLLNTREYLQMRREAFINDGLGEKLNPSNPIANYSSFRDFYIWDTTRYTDWQKLLIDNPAGFTTANVDVSGGNANTQALIGAGYSSLGTTMPGNYKDQRVSFHINVNNTSQDQRFRMQLSAGYSHDNSDLPGVNLVQYVTLAPDAPAPFDAQGNLNWAFIHLSALNRDFETFYNPLAFTKSTNNAVTELLHGNLSLNYSMTKGLDISASLGYNKMQAVQTNISPSTGSPPPFNTNPDSRYSEFSTSNNHSWIIEPKITYHVAIGKGILNALVGSTFISNSTDSRAETATGFTSDALITNLMAASTLSFVGASQSLYHYSAAYGQLGYIWQEKYILNLTGRRDGSSRFGPNKQFGNFGAVGVGWIFSKEKWIENLAPVLSFGKFRGSYGIAGSDGIGDYQFLSTYTPTGISYQGGSGLAPTALTNPNFQWQQTQKLEVGTELGFLQDRINLTASWYRNRTGNQLVGYPLSSITGFASVTANLGALIQNTGLEFTLNSTNIKTKNFSWRTSFNTGINHNKLIRFPGIENTPYSSLYVVGQSLNIRQYFHYTGVDPQTGLYTVAFKNGNGFSGYDVLFKEIKQPWAGGIQNSFIFKGFELEFFIQLVEQQGVKYTAQFPMPGTGDFISGANQPREVLSRWQHSGDNSAIAKFSSGLADQSYLFYQASDGVITDASFARLKSLSVTYSLPATVVKTAHFSNASIYLRCQNLFTLTKYKGLDPETQGVQMPPMRTVTAGIQIGL